MAKIGINLSTGSLQKDEIIVGIDLGTTNSLVAIIHPDTNQPLVLKEFDSSSMVPSVIYFDEYDNPVVGDKAKSFLESQPERTIFSAKRLIGKSYYDLKKDTSTFLSYRIIDDSTDAMVKVQVGEKFYSPIELSSLILKELKVRAEHILKTPVNKAVITVPAYFNDAQRQATRDAGKLAGLDVLRIINEPTAASLAYGLGLQNNKDEKEKIIAVYDLGGGTFDISVLRIVDGIFEVLATNGDTHLGGDDLDQAIIDYWLEENGMERAEIMIEKSKMQTLRIKAEQAKKTLSVAENFEEKLNEMSLFISKEKFESIIFPLIERTIQCCKNVLKDAGIAKTQIDTIVMVGGSTRVPFVKKKVSEFFGKAINDSVNPDEVVALGAAIQADILSGNNKQTLLLDITPLSLGIETAGGLMDVLIPRNSKIPSKASRQYTTQIDGQSAMRISVFQGERDMVKDNRKLAEFSLTGIPGMPAGLPKIEVSFLINADGILTVSAKELRSGINQSIEVKPQYGLSDNEVEEMLLDSIKHAKEDIALRALTEAKTEGEQLLKTTEKFLINNKNYITEEELMQTANAMQALQLAITMNDKDVIQKKTEELNNISRPYAERIMDHAIGKAMSGKKI